MEQYHITYVSRRTNEENDEGEEESDSLGSPDSSDNDDVDGDHDGEEDFVFEGSEATPSEESQHTERWRCRRLSNGEEDDGEEDDDEEYDDKEDHDA